MANEQKTKKFKAAHILGGRICAKSGAWISHTSGHRAEAIALKNDVVALKEQMTDLVQRMTKLEKKGGK